jgi:hypothetical protein
MDRILSDDRLQEAVHRLLITPYDLMACGVQFAGPGAPQTGAPLHRKIFYDYMAELRPEVWRVANWWLKGIARLTGELGSADEARRTLILEYPAGPAADMHFIAIVRRYWLSCSQCNDSLPIGQWVDPQVLLLQWTIAAKETTCVEVLASQPYWPLGLTREGTWF